MITLGRVVGAVWAAPYTLLGLVLMLILGCHYRGRTATTTLVFLPGSWLYLKMKQGKWSGFCIADVILVRDEYQDDARVLGHELRHVFQCHLFGVLVPVAWVGALFVGAVLSWRTLYRNHPWERDARRAAGEETPVELGDTHGC